MIHKIKLKSILLERHYLDGKSIYKINNKEVDSVRWRACEMHSQKKDSYYKGYQNGKLLATAFKQKNTVEWGCFKTIKN